jgi:hypothetical protein
LKQEENKIAMKAAADDKQRERLQALMTAKTQALVEESMIVGEVLDDVGDEDESEPRDVQMDEDGIIDVGSSDVDDDDAAPSHSPMSAPGSDAESSGRALPSASLQHKKHITVLGIVRPSTLSAASQEASKVCCHTRC